MNVYLIGYRGSGKTTVARLLAERLAWAWIDADEELERRAERSISEIFAESGEQAFRDLESAVVASLALGDKQVVALGGGAVLREENPRVIAASGKVVWLRARPQTLLARIEADPATSQRRPNLAGGGLAEIEELLAVRTPIYQACADLVLDVDASAPEAVAEEIAAWLANQDGADEAGSGESPERL